LARREGLTEELAHCVGDYESEQFTPGERVAIRYAELLAANHKAIDDELFARLRGEFTDAEVLDLTLCLAVYLGLGRSLEVLGIDESCALDV